tara:strand:- start:930 stop:1088 length:159 start_codon:yes stop_codon:yes gene_type:complete
MSYKHAFVRVLNVMNIELRTSFVVKHSKLNKKALSASGRERECPIFLALKEK